MAALAEPHDREAEQHREQQHLQDLALREGADHGVGNDVQHEVDALLRLGLLGIAGDRLGVRRSIAEARAGLHQIADQQSDHQGEGRDDLEIDQRLDADATDLLGILDMGDARDDGAEDDRRDHHLDQLDEAVAERLDPLVGGKRRPERASQRAKHDRDQDLDVENFVPRLAAGTRRRSRGNGCRCHVSPPSEIAELAKINLAVQVKPELSWLCCLPATICRARRHRVGAPCREIDLPGKTEGS